MKKWGRLEVFVSEIHGKLLNNPAGRAFRHVTTCPSKHLKLVATNDNPQVNHACKRVNSQRFEDQKKKKMKKSPEIRKEKATNNISDFWMFILSTSKQNFFGVSSTQKTQTNSDESTARDVIWITNSNQQN